MAKVLGFTGTREGCSKAQHEVLASWIEQTNLQHWEGLHGDCIGADAQFDLICKSKDIPTSCRPGNNKAMRAYATVEKAKPAPPLVRNKLIVADCAVLLACPPTKEELVRSGTWSTIRYSRKANKPLVIFFPDGTASIEMNNA